MIIPNQIINIDVLEGFKNLDDKSINHILTSPPYNRKRNDKYQHYTDIKENYFEWLCLIIDECLRVTKGYVFFNVQKNYYNKKDIFKLFGKFSRKIQDIIIWEKTNPMPAAGKAVTNSYEFFIVLSDNPLRSNSTYTKNLIATSVNGDMPTIHKAVMKQDVADWIIKSFTQPNDLILDCFVGVGTTAISCIKYNRRYIGFDIVKEYIEVAEKRIKEVAGCKAESDNGIPPMIMFHIE